MMIRKPVEISAKNVHKKLEEIKHPHCDHPKLINLAVGFLKFLYVREINTDTSATDGYVPLMANILGNYIGKNPQKIPVYYPYVLDALERIKLISIKHQYKKQTAVAKGQAKGYRLNLISPFETENDTLDKKYEKTWRVDDPQYLSYIHGISIDEMKYVLIANLLHPPKRLQAMRILDFWTNNCHYVNRDDYGRLHSWLTQMPRELRPALNRENQQIYEVDVHACQPTLMLLLVYDEMSSKQLSANEISQLYPDVQRYIDSIASGKFYEVLYRKAKRNKTKPIEKSDLDKFKIDLLSQVFFSKVPINERGAIHHFKVLYPTVYQVIHDLKLKYGYEYLSQELQRMESNIMNETICLIKDNTDNWHLRFHDAILCTIQDVDLIAECLSHVLTQKMGFAPKLKNGLWGGKDFNQQLSSVDLTFREFDLEVGYETSRLHSIRKAKRKIFGSDEAEAEQKNLYYKYMNHLRNPEVAEEVENKKKIYLEAKLVYPFTWDNEQIAQFKTEGLKKIVAVLECNAEMGLEFDKTLLKPARQYWTGVFS